MRSVPFLIPTISSNSPSYVNCVHNGVTMSVLRSRMINESIGPGVSGRRDSGVREVEPGGSGGGS